MEAEASADITSLLLRVSRGDAAAEGELYEALYAQLHRQARSYMQGQPGEHTLQTTALVNEAYLKLTGRTDTAWANRGHFLAVAARAMRSVLVDHARGKQRLKRSGGRRVSLEGLSLAENAATIDLLDLHQALERLSAQDPRAAQVVELRFFGGMSAEEAAGHLRVSKRTADRAWRLARAWLLRELA